MLFRDLPCDLETEILARVPANSLAKLKTTCKRWYSLFKDAKFVEKNLAKAAAKEEVIFLMRYGVYSISFNNLHGSSGDPSMDITGKLRCLKELKDLEISKIIGCNGLVLCSTKYNRRLVVWNPCTGETRSTKPRNCYNETNMFGLGYGYSKSDYKILRFFSYYDEYNGRRVSKFDIYDLSSDSWKMLDDVTHQKWSLLSQGVSLRGITTYWLASRKEPSSLRTFLGFDYRTERFVSSPLPFQPALYNSMSVLSVVKQEKIALLHQNLDTLSLETTIWLTNKIDEGKPVSWTKLFVVDFLNSTKTSFKTVESFLLDEEKKVAVCCSRGLYDGRVFLHIVGKDLHRQVYRDSTTRCLFEHWPCLLSYVPSLIRIPQ